jgi:uncharacterized membrane protein (UPF0127 family)
MNNKRDDLGLKMADGSGSIRVRLARSFWSRLRGLLGRRTLPAQKGILLDPCSSVHTIGMQFPIDIVFLSRDDQVLAIHKRVAPGRLCISVRGARRVLELACGSVELLVCKPGDYLTFYAASDEVDNIISDE